MARIPDDELERLKREVDLAELVRSSGVELEKRGSSLVGLCPMHDDKEPSLVVTPSKNLWSCLGACGTGGTVIDWVMKTQGVSFRHAVMILRQGEPLGPVSPVKRARVPKLPCPLSEDAAGGRLLLQAIEYYHQTLLESPEATAFLDSRGINDPEAIATFKLGFANRSLGLTLPAKKTKAGALMRGRLAEVGLLRDTGHEHFCGSLSIPIFDAEGEVVEVYGRKIRNDLAKGTAYHLYLPGPHRGIWNLSALRESREIILCEALIDALTFWCAGFKNVNSSFGTNGFTGEMLEAFKAYGTERVLIAYDRDEAGDTAATRLAERLGAEGIVCFRVRFPRGMDANEYALKVSPPARSLGLLLRSAQYMEGPLRSLAVAPAPAKGSGPRAQGSVPPARPSSGSGARGPGSEPPALHGEEKAKDSTSACVITAPEAASSLAAASPPTGAVMTQEIAGSAPSRAPDPGARTPPAASPLAPPPAVDIPAEVSAHEVVIVLGDRRWRVRGLARNLSYEQLRINLLVSCSEHFHVDSLDLYSSRQRGVFLKQASVELQVKQEVLAKDLGQVLMKLEQIQEERITKALEPVDTTVKLTEEETTAALELLRDPKLLERISTDLEACGLVGEHTNKLVAYLAGISRKLDKPLGVMVQSSSAAGKSALMEAVLALCPDEERVQYSAMTGQSLFYMGETDLKHKVLAIAEEEGAERASYALKLLQSEGKLSIASTGKDPKTGKHATHEYYVEGPAAILLTTTAIDLDEELLNRCILLAVDESREQTEAIHQMQREERTFQGLARRLARKDLRTLHQNAQRLIRPLYVVNPYSPRLTFLTSTTRTRRDHLKYHGLIESIALLHQHQREVKSGVIAERRVDYIEVELADIVTANRLASEVLGRTLDELPPQTRDLLFLVHRMVTAACKDKRIEQKHYRFTRRQVREHTGWGNTQLKIHFHRLEEMEYLLVHRGGRGQSFVYELLYDGEGQKGERFVLGLINSDRLEQVAAGDYHPNRSGHNADRSGSSRPQVGGVSGGGRSGPTDEDEEDNPTFQPKSPKNASSSISSKQPVIAAAARSKASE
jgi:DNA primase